jgi:CheY-like chemotaxis protein
LACSNAFIVSPPTPVLAWGLLYANGSSSAPCFRGELTVVDDGESAIHLIQSLDQNAIAVCPDLVIIDLNLPRRSGCEVLEIMRRCEKCRHIPVVILSSSDALQDRAEAARLGATRYIRKPSRLEDFLALGATFREIIDSRS